MILALKKKSELSGLTKEERLTKAKEWIGNFEGDNIVKAYSKSTSLNLKNAMKELRRLSVKISSEEKAEVKRWVENKRLHHEGRKLKKQRKKEAQDNDKLMMEYDSDETFAFIAGYTSGGAPYGIMHEEMEELESFSTSEKSD